jgi:hypothetical protein
MSEPREPVALADYEPRAIQHRAALLRPIAALEEILESQKAVAEVIARALVNGQDYGIIPGTSRRGRDGKETGKPTLLKPGAERVLLTFGCYPDYKILASEADHSREVQWVKKTKKYRNRTRDDKEWDWIEEHGTSLGLYRYVVKCDVVQRSTGEIIGSGIGVCSTLESKYVDRPRDLENTVLKMAEKRGLVAAVLNTFGLSDRFSQDLEDMPPIEDAEYSPVSSAAPVRNTRAGQAAAPVTVDPPTNGKKKPTLVERTNALRDLMATNGFDEQQIEWTLNLVNAEDTGELKALAHASRWKDIKSGACTPETLQKEIDIAPIDSPAGTPATQDAYADPFADGGPSGLGSDGLV